MNTPAKIVAVGAALASSAVAGTAPETHPSLEDRIAIGDVIAGIGLYADQHEWDRLEASFTPEVTTDYVSLFGGEPQTQSSGSLVRAWRGLLPGFDATQHLITPIEVLLRDPDHARARSYVRATHRLGTDRWIVGGLYTQELVRSPDGWRVSVMRFSLAYEEGDRGLVTRAVERARDHQPLQEPADVDHG